MKSEKQHILKFAQNFINSIEELDYDSEVSFIDFLILDKHTQKIRMCIEFKKDATKKEKMFEQLQRTKGVINIKDTYSGFYGAVNSAHFYIKDSEWNDITEFELKDVEKIQKWLKTNLIDKDIVIDKDYWESVFEKCGFVQTDTDLFDTDGNTITYEKVLEYKNKYIEEKFDEFIIRCGANEDFSFADMFFNEIGIFNTLPYYRKKERFEFNDVVLEDGYKEYLQLHYQELIFEQHQRKRLGAYYTKLNVTEMMWEMIRKHIDIDDYYIWDPCCGTGNLFRDRNNEVFDFIDKDKLYLSDIDLTAVNICKQDFKPSNVFGYNYQKTIITEKKNSEQVNMFVDEQCFQYDYQNTVIDNFIGMPNKLKNIIKENPEKLFIVCNPPYLQLQGTNPESFYVPKTLVANEFRNYGVMAVADTYRQYMIWCNEQYIRRAKKCYIVPINWTYTRQTEEKRNTLNIFRNNINQNFIDMFVVSNCEFDNVNRYDPIGIFLVGNDKGEYSWSKFKQIPVVLPEDEKSKIKFKKEMNKINDKYNLHKHLPGLVFEFNRDI